MTTFSRTTAAGFTLVETMVAIAILSIAMTGPFYAAQQSLTASVTAKNQLTATMIAQEGIEYVREVRDADFLAINSGATRTWMYGLDGSQGSPNCFTPHKCTVDPISQVTFQCSNDSCSPYPLYINAVNYLYNQSGNGTPSIFTRSMQLTTVSANEVKVVATVNWLYHNTPKSTSVTEYLTNWQ